MPVRTKRTQPTTTLTKRTQPSTSFTRRSLPTTSFSKRGALTSIWYYLTNDSADRITDNSGNPIMVGGAAYEQNTLRYQDRVIPTTVYTQRS